MQSASIERNYLDFARTTPTRYQEAYNKDLGITMKPEPSTRPMSRGEKETETEATRLIEHIEEALAAVAIRSEIDTLEAVADRIERAARDLSAALRELAQQRRIPEDAMK